MKAQFELVGKTSTLPAKAAVALGSNLPSRWGTPGEALREALRRLGDLGRVIAASSFHVTEPVGLHDQPRFINAAALLETALSPEELLRALLSIEAAMGRVRSADSPPKGPRIIDLDLLLYQDANGESRTATAPHAVPALLLPHPAMHERRFVLAPLAEIAPDMRHPLLRKTVQQLLDGLPVAELQPPR